MAKSARERSTCAAGALSERLRRVNSLRSAAVSGRRRSVWWRDMGHLGARGAPRNYTSSHGKRLTRAFSAYSGGANRSYTSLDGPPFIQVVAPHADHDPSLFQAVEDLPFQALVLELSARRYRPPCRREPGSCLARVAPRSGAASPQSAPGWLFDLWASWAPLVREDLSRPSSPHLLSNAPQMYSEFI